MKRLPLHFSLPSLSISCTVFCGQCRSYPKLPSRRHGAGSGAGEQRLDQPSVESTQPCSNLDFRLSLSYPELYEMDSELTLASRFFAVLTANNQVYVSIEQPTSSTASLSQSRGTRHSLLLFLQSNPVFQYAGWLCRILSYTQNTHRSEPRLTCRKETSYQHRGIPRPMQFLLFDSQLGQTHRPSVPLLEKQPPR